MEWQETADMQRLDERRDYERTLSERRKDAGIPWKLKWIYLMKNIEQQKQETNEQVAMIQGWYFVDEWHVKLKKINHAGSGIQFFMRNISINKWCVIQDE